MRRPGGLTLLELILGLGLLSLLLLMMFLVYRSGASAWKKAEAQTDLLRQAEVVTARLSREAARSVYSSVSLDPGPGTGTAVAFLHSWNELEQRFEYDPANRSPVWQKYIVFYHDSATREVRWKEEPLVPPSPAAVPLTNLASLRSGGRLLAENVSDCRFTLSPGFLSVYLKGEKKRYGAEAPEIVELSTKVHFRN